MGQLPVTCGLFFSLGHSTIVIVVNVAIAISTDVYNRIDGVGTIGGIVGSAVSGSFLFIVGLANSIILWRIIKQRRHDRNRRRQQLANGVPSTELDEAPVRGHHNQMLMMRILGPIITFVDRPWKMYPVGVLFGFGFDTASSIALLAVSAIAKKGSDGKSIPSRDIVILPLLFTAGMTLIDSCDSILMLYSYSGFPEHSWAIFQPSKSTPPGDMNDLEDHDPLPQKQDFTVEVQSPRRESLDRAPSPTSDGITNVLRLSRDSRHIPSATSAPNIPHPASDEKLNEVSAEDKATVLRDQRVKMNMMSGLSIILTLMSILVAFSISLITIMGLIGDNCRKCREAANAPGGGGLAGSWWRGWAKANDNSGYIGAAIVGVFVTVVGSWYGSRWVVQKWRYRREKQDQGAH